LIHDWALSTLALAALEEALKAALARATLETRFQVPSYFTLFLFELLQKLEPTYEYMAWRGIHGWILLFGTIIVPIGSSIFHLYTSILYAKTNHVIIAFLYCTMIHFLRSFRRLAGQLAEA
jgi:hypothetical protein